MLFSGDFDRCPSGLGWGWALVRTFNVSRSCRQSACVGDCRTHYPNSDLDKTLSSAVEVGLRKCTTIALHNDELGTNAKR